MLEVLDIDSASFLGLHTYIFQPTCAVPGCHDGNFEPDFRTVQSSYNTLLYAPVIKNDDAGTFTYRVIPGDTALSWLHERITTDDEVLGRMPCMTPCIRQNAKKITTWILDGAKDVMGNSPSFPTTSLYHSVSSPMKMIRWASGWMRTVQMPFHPLACQIIPWLNSGSGFMIRMSTAAIWEDGIWTTIKLESARNHTFYRSCRYSMEVLDALTPYIGPLFWDPLVPVPYYHHFTINTADFDPGSYYFMRFYVDDGDHPEPTEIPNTGSPSYLLTYFSFYIQE